MRNSEEKRLQRVVATVSAALFVVFSFLFVAVYQAPLLEAFYNSISTGRLQYNPWMVGGIVSLSLTLLALWLNRFTGFKREWTAMAYLPSSLILAFITDIDRTIYTGGGSMKGWLLILAAVVPVYAIFSFMLRRMLFESIKSAAMSQNRMLWRNLMLLILQFCLVGTLSNSEENFKRETRVASFYNAGMVDKALEVGYKSLNASRELTAMRAYLLANEGLLGERVFEYPQYYGVEGLFFPSEQTSPFVPDSVYSLIGATPAEGESAVEFLERTTYADSANVVARDYYLTSLLLDRRLVKFKDEVLAIYGAKGLDALPKHYREALLLYADIDTTAAGDYAINDATMLKRLQRMRAEEALHPDLYVRSNYVRRYYGNTYWWYFIYGM